MACRIIPMIGFGRGEKKCCCHIQVNEVTSFFGLKLAILTAGLKEESVVKCPLKSVQPEKILRKFKLTFVYLDQS